ncbi:hypothetical protein DYB25_002769 [Aphanomyces astaci]|uniref:Protein kinase domain-containing protein n=1 Tax=Aphanomyces astaci TaxID=112090 RepID=A0A397AZT3_APHAT|nr:hypothetical protein DYB25_002769 [Aphanomyces astaci]
MEASTHPLPPPATPSPPASPTRKLSLNDRPKLARTPSATIQVVETEVAAVKVDDAGAPHRVNDYVVVKQLGEGAFAKVYLVERTKDEATKQFAMKVFNKSFLKRKREFKKVDGKMVQTNAFQVIDSPDDDKMFLILELLSGGQIMEFNAKSLRYTYPEEGMEEAARLFMVQNCLLDIALALEHCRPLGCTSHTTHNVLVTDTGFYKLGDFGVAYMFTEDNASNALQLKSTEGTYHFLAPECTTGEPYDPFKVDIWALGVTIYAMLFGTVPFGGHAETVPGILTSIRDDPLVFPSESSIPSDLQELVLAMLDKNPTSRISVGDILHHAWLVEHSVLKRPSPTQLVEVTVEDIDLAFTPINNFILMTKLKMKMHGRLSHARLSLSKRLSSSSSPGSPPRSPDRNLPSMREFHEDDLHAVQAPEPIEPSGNSNTSDACSLM